MAKKAKSTLLNMFLSLTIIAVVAAGLLALMSYVTKKPIADAKQEKINKAILAVLSKRDENDSIIARIEYDATKMKHDTIRLDPNDKGGYNDSVICHLAYNKDGEYVGAAVEAMDAQGFGGTIKIMVGFTADGEIYGYQVLETNETPGLGAKADKWFQEGNKGCIIGKNPSSELAVSKDEKDGVDAITGSTITSRAFLRGVNKAYKNLQTSQK